MKRIGIAAVSLLLACLAGCGNGTSAPTGGSSETASDGPSGEILVLNHRTDLDQNGTLAAYVTEFQKIYPNVTVKFESITAYDEEVPMRLQTGDFGDVLTMPTGIKNNQLTQFFAPLGSVAELGTKYQFVNDFAVDGQVYALAQGGIASGIVYNKRIFAEAGVTTPPTSYDDFFAALKAVKQKTDAIPLYTNYKDGWPLGNYDRNMGAATGNANAKNDMAASDTPWAEGNDAYWVDSIIYDAVAQGLTEADPTTTNWEESKTLIGTGKVATLVLQSWAISQMQAAAKDAGADPADIGFLPIPSATAGKSFSAVVGDRYFVINKNSKNPEAARAWMDWMINQSPYAADEGFVPTAKGAALPSNLSGLTELGVEIFEPKPAPADKAGYFSSIDQAAELGWDSAPYRQALVDSARAGTPKAEAFAALNDKWAKARAQVG